MKTGNRGHVKGEKKNSLYYNFSFHLNVLNLGRDNVDALFIIVIYLQLNDNPAVIIGR